MVLSLSSTFYGSATVTTRGTYAMSQFYLPRNLLYSILSVGAFIFCYGHHLSIWWVPYLVIGHVLQHPHYQWWCHLASLPCHLVHQTAHSYGVGRFVSHLRNGRWQNQKCPIGIISSELSPPLEAGDSCFWHVILRTPYSLSSPSEYLVKSG